MEEEIWKDIEGFEGYYQVSSLGRVRSLDRIIIRRDGIQIHKKEKILKQAFNEFGYNLVNLCKNNVHKTYLVHRLVAEAFIPNPDNLPQVNHKSEFEKTDNRVCNLEWCDAKYNSNYGTRNERRVDKKSKKVYQYTLDGILVKIWQSTKECGRNGFSNGNIVSCCLGNKWHKTHKGYIWRYEPL